MDLREKTREELLCEIHNLKKTCDYLYNASCNLDDISTFNRKLSSGTEQIASSYRKIVSIRNMLADITDYQYMPVKPAFHIEKKEGMYYEIFSQRLGLMNRCHTGLRLISMRGDCDMNMIPMYIIPDIDQPLNSG